MRASLLIRLQNLSTHPHLCAYHRSRGNALCDRFTGCLSSPSFLFRRSSCAPQALTPRALLRPPSRLHLRQTPHHSRSRSHHRPGPANLHRSYLPPPQPFVCLRFLQIQSIASARRTCSGSPCSPATTVPAMRCAPTVLLPGTTPRKFHASPATPPARPRRSRTSESS